MATYLLGRRPLLRRRLGPVLLPLLVERRRAGRPHEDVFVEVRGVHRHLRAQRGRPGRLVPARATPRPAPGPGPALRGSQLQLLLGAAGAYADVVGPRHQRHLVARALQMLQQLRQVRRLRRQAARAWAGGGREGEGVSQSVS